MMRIGEFALTSGLTPKTLRFYDERGVLVPEDVDANGYRRYSARQLVDATTIRVLRAAGLSLTDISLALREPDQLDHLLQRHREQLRQERATQDCALELTTSLLPRYDDTDQVRTRHAPATPWCGVRVEVSIDDAQGDAETERVNERFGALHNALTEMGNPPNGPFWTSMSQEPVGGQVSMLLCWPVARPVADPAALQEGLGVDVVAGVLPERTEAFVRWDVTDEGLDLMDDHANGPLVPPLSVAHLRYVEEHELDASEVRQIGVLDEEGNPVAYDLAITVDPA